METTIILLCALLLAALCTCPSEAAKPGDSGTYTNPIIPGDWSDPALIHVGDDYYSLRSTFGWQPGLFIAHSKDLIHWEYIGHVYTDHPSIQPGNTEHGCWGAEMGYNPNNDTYLAYAPMGFKLWAFVSKHPSGPYSAGSDLEINGIDPGFFADEDGKLYLTWADGKIVELNSDGLSVKREVCDTGLGNGVAFEGPQLYKHNGYYYCIYSTGGTLPHEFSTISCGRAKDIAGPWEKDPNNPLMEALDTSGAPLQGPAHGALVSTKNGEWFMGYHAFELSHYSLGRQMCLEQMEWTEDGWIRPVNGRIPSVKAKKPNLPEVRYEQASSDEFDKAKLGYQWFFHTKPDYSGESWSLTDRPGCLRIHTRPGDINSFNSLTNILLQRVNAKKFELSAKVEFDAKSGSEAAGVHLWHDPTRNLWLSTTIKDGSKILEVGKYANGEKSVLWTTPNTIGSTVYLKIAVDGEEHATFFYSADNKAWTKLGEPVYFGDAGTKLRSGVSIGLDLGWVGTKMSNGWTGTTMGIFAVQNGSGTANNADFDWFRVTND